MKRQSRLVEVSILLVVATVLACGPNRGSKLTAKKGGGTDPSANSKPQQAGNKFEGQLVTRLKTRNGGASKPTMDSSFLKLADEAIRAYQDFGRKDPKQAEMNEQLTGQFSDLVIQYPVLNGDTARIGVQTPDGKWVFEGDVDVKKDRRGKLKATKLPENIESTTTSVNFVDDTESEVLDEENLVSGKALARPTPKIKKPQTNKPAAAPAAPVERFYANAYCFDGNCQQMLIRIVDVTRGFYPVFVKAMAIESQNQSIVTSLIDALADRIKTLAQQKNLKITENPGNNVKWSADWTETGFQIKNQSMIHLVDERISTEFHLLNANGDNTGIEARIDDANLSNTSLRESLVSVNPKK